MQAITRIRPFYILLALLTSIACRQQPEAAAAGVEQTTPVQKYDWTGTYLFADEGAEMAYTLRLHRRSVDGSYEMQYSRSVEAQTNNYAEYMFDAKDADSSITIRFMGSFTAAEKDWPFKKGDTMCVLSLKPGSGIETAWKALQPKSGQGGFRQVSKDYH